MVVGYLQALDHFHLIPPSNRAKPSPSWRPQSGSNGGTAGELPPAEYEKVYYRSHGAPQAA